MKLWRGQPDHDHWRRPFSSTEKAVAWAGFGLCFLVLGAVNWLTPQAPPFSGKWSWLHSALYETFGPRGIPAGMFAAGALFLIAALLTWRKAIRENVP
jgi:hypothetical protein